MLVSRSSLAGLVFACALLFHGRAARADPWFGWGDNRVEDQLADGDIDVEDLVEGMRIGRSRGGSQELRTGTWVTLAPFLRTVDGKVDIGGQLIVSAAFDRIARGPVHDLSRPELLAIADGPTPPTPALPVAPSPPAGPAIAITPGVARLAVAAAWRNTGLGDGDARIDAMIARARQSAALPETRFRIMKVLDDSSQIGVIPTDTSTYDIAGANLYLEARFTWRLDRLLYADDEPTLERTRIERQDARERVSGKVIDSLFQWQRAQIALRGAVAGGKEQIDATLRVAEAEAALDVLTGGWFGAWRARQPTP